MQKHRLRVVTQFKSAVKKLMERNSANFDSHLYDQTFFVKRDFYEFLSKCSHIGTKRFSTEATVRNHIFNDFFHEVYSSNYDMPMPAFGFLHRGDLMLHNYQLTLSNITAFGGLL